MNYVNVVIDIIAECVQAQNSLNLLPNLTFKKNQEKYYKSLVAKTWKIVSFFFNFIPTSRVQIL